MNETPSRFARGRGARWMLSVALVAVGMAAGVGLQRLDVSPKLLLPRLTRSVTVVRPSPNVVTAIRELSRLESAEYHLERVMDVKDVQTHAFGLLSAEDSLLLVVAGDVVAGVDLSELDAAAVQVDSATKQVTVELPPARVLSARLDSGKTYVHSRRTDLLAKHSTSLESEARARAEKELTAAATEAGILDKASKNASRTVEDLLRALGFSKVQVSVRVS